MPPTLFSCGSNAGGQLGLGHREDVRMLAPVGSGENPFPPLGHQITHLAAGANHAACLLRAPSGGNTVYLTGLRLDVPAHPFAPRGEGGYFSPLMDEQVGKLLTQAGAESPGGVWQPTHLACAWDTTLISFRPSGGGGDVLLALSTPDEVGKGLVGPQTTQTGPFLVPLREGLEDADQQSALLIHSLCAGPRHALAYVSIPSEAGRKHLVLGWGAARHGQLGPVELGEKDRRPGRKGRTSHLPPRIVAQWLAPDDQAEVAIAAGQAHTLILLPPSAGGERHLLRLGHDAAGQISIPSAVQGSVSDVGSCWKTSAALLRSKDGDQLLLFGNGAHGQLGSRTAAKAIARGEEMRRAQADLAPHTHVEQMRCGSEHVVLLVASAGKDTTPHILCWGWNEHGNLGLGDEGQMADVDNVDQGDRPDRWEPTELPLPPGMTPLDCWAGCGTTYVLASDKHTLPPGLEKDCADLPKVELHAHLHGSLRRRTVARWAAAEGQDASHAEISLGDQRSLSAMFAVFDVLHHAVGGATAEAVRDGTREVLEDMARQGVVYAELRTTPRVLPGCEDEWTYLSTVGRGIRDFLRIQSSWPERLPARRLLPRLILSINRSHGPEAAERVVDLLLEAKWLPSSHPCTGLLVGLDVSGDPTKGSFESIRPALERARRAGIKVTLHMAEDGGELGRRDTDAMLAFAPERVGHAIFLSPQQWTTLCAKQIFAEVCLTSNVFTQSVQSYHTHHVAAFLGLEPWRGTSNLLSPPPCALATDDTTVFGSDLTSEYVHLLSAFPSQTLARAREMNKAALEASFLSLGEKARIAQVLDQTQCI